MERSRWSQVTVVSRWWTPEHLDVTDAPLLYAPPKGDWIGRLPRRDLLRSMDDRDRMARRRQSSRSVIARADLLVAPPIVAAPVRGTRLRERVAVLVRRAAAGLAARDVGPQV